MAKYGSTLATVKVYIDGKEQAKKELDELKEVAKQYKDQMALANEQMERMSAALEQNSAAFNQLTKLLQGGISAHLDGLENYRQQKKNERFLKRRGID